MAHDETNRRDFLRAGAIASAANLASEANAQEADAKKAAELPRRPLGKTGVNVTILDQGFGGKGEGLNRLLRYSYASGVRMFDTAHEYGTEPNFRTWFERSPEVRKQIFLVTKDMPREPRDMIRMLDERLETLGTDYVDLFFIHQLGDGHPLDKAISIPKSREFKEAADAIRKSGKARFIGFSTHHKQRAPIIQAAAEGGIVDAIMLQYNPWLVKETDLDKALDACWKKGIGLISMKQIAGKSFGDTSTKGINVLDEVERRVPELAARKLTRYQGLLHAIWTDERISSACVSMRNTDQVRQNTDAARSFEPLKQADILQLRDAVLADGPTLCADCDGRCAIAGGTRAELGDLTRFLTYHEHHGLRTETRRHYAALSDEARDWSGADLEAARAACPNHLDFARLLPEVERHLA
jgi:predicted aldo/keto reductase-like oxidoreductase